MTQPDFQIGDSGHVAHHNALKAGKLDVAVASAIYVATPSGGTDGQALVKAGAATTWASVGTALAAKLGLFDAIVDTAGGGTHTTLEAALAAVPAKGRIAVVSDLTITSTVVFTREVEVEWFMGKKVFNNAAAGTDTFKSSIPIGSNGQVDNVTMRRPYLSRTGLGGVAKAGKAVNLHGAYNWVIDRPIIEHHEFGLYFDASPFPSGQCSSNLIRKPSIVTCTSAIHFAGGSGSANLNTIENPLLYGCTTYVYSGAGLGNVVADMQLTNLGPPAAGPLVVNDGGVLHLPNFHVEGNAASHIFALNGGSTFGSGQGYFDPAAGGGGSGIAVVADAVRDMHLVLQGGPTFHRSTGTTTHSVSRSRVDFVGNVAEWAAPDTANGTPIVRAAVRSDGPVRLTPRTTDPVFSNGAAGDLLAFTTASGKTVLRIRDSSAYRQMVQLDLKPTEVKLPDVATSGKIFTVHRALSAETLSSFVLVPDGFVAYTATDFWTVVFEEWNGNSKVGDIATFTQAAQVPLSATSVSAASYALASGRHVRAKFTATGAPPAWSSPLIQTLYSVA